MFCRKCGKEISRNMRFCPACGTEVSIQETVKGHKARRSSNTDNGRVPYLVNASLCVLTVLTVVLALFLLRPVLLSAPSASETETATESTPVSVDQTKQVPSDTESLLRDWYSGNYDKSGIVVALMADVTHNGMQDLIIVTHGEESMSIIGQVYAVDQNGVVQKIEEISGSEVHAGGFLGWYLKQTESGYDLVQETFAMWQGYGKVDVTEYHLDLRGNRIVDSYACAMSEDDSPVGNAEWNGYLEEGGSILDGAYLIYNSSSNFSTWIAQMDEHLILEQSGESTVAKGISQQIGVWQYCENGGDYYYFDGVTTVTMTEGNRVAVTNLDGSASEFPIGYTNETAKIVGVTKNSVYIDAVVSYKEDGRPNRQIIAYSFSGEQRGITFSANRTRFEDGHLILKSNREYVWPSWTCVIDPNDMVILEEEELWDACVRGGKVFYLRPLSYYGSGESTVEIYSIAEGKRVLEGCFSINAPDGKFVNVFFDDDKVVVREEEIVSGADTYNVLATDFFYGFDGAPL